MGGGRVAPSFTLLAPLCHSGTLCRWLPWGSSGIEWHVFFVCPLYFTLRRALPFTGNQVCVEGLDVQGDGCLPSNLTSLVRHIMALPSIDVVVDFLLQAMKKRRESRHNPFPFQ